MRPLDYFVGMKKNQDRDFTQLTIVDSIKQYLPISAKQGIWTPMTAISTRSLRFTRLLKPLYGVSTWISHNAVQVLFHS